MKNNFSVKYSALATSQEDAEANGKSAISYDSIFKYSSGPSQWSSSNDQFGEYWQPRNYNVITESNENVLWYSFVRLFLHPPFAFVASNDRSRLSTNTENFLDTASLVAIQVGWSLMFFVFAFTWLLLFPFHWWWTISRVRSNEAVVIFRAGQSPIVQTKAGSLICLWPPFDRMFRVHLSRRGFSVPPCQIGLKDGTFVRLGADISFHVVDPLLFVRMSSDTAASMRHVVQGQFIKYLNEQSLDTLQKYVANAQVELRLICTQHLSQFGIVVDTLVLSPVEVIREAPDHAQELIQNIVSAVKSPGAASSFSTLFSSLMPSGSVPFSADPSATTEATKEEPELSPQQPSESGEGLDGSSMTRMLKTVLNQISGDARTILGVGPSDKYRLTIGDNDSWLLIPFTAEVEGPMTPPTDPESVAGSLEISSWETFHNLRDGHLSPMIANLTGQLSTTGDAATLAKLIDPSKINVG